jgi:hypothetical protein
MANLNKRIELTGSLDNYSVYKMKGSDKVIIRKKGGPTREQVLKSDRYIRTRENTTEFGIGVGKAVSAIRFPLLHVKHLSDYNFTPILTSICTRIQKEDKTGDRGQRSIFLSQHRYMLESFMLHKKHPFNSIVAAPVNCTLNRETKSAVIQLPWLTDGINLRLPWKQPFYRFCMSLGLVSDIVYEDGQYNDHAEDRAYFGLDTAWHVVTTPFQPQTVELKLDTPHALKDSQTLVFAIGIEMGTPGLNGTTEEVKRAGSACILAVG